MSRGLGKTQRRLIDILNEDEDRGLSVKELARRADISERQCLTACRSLEKRELVAMHREAGDVIPRYDLDPIVSSAGVIPQAYYSSRGVSRVEKLYSLSKGDPLPWQPGWTAARDLDVYPGFTPGGWRWLVWPEKHIQRFKDAEAYWSNLPSMMQG